ncbi:MAG TPA: hypothetical protein VHM19_19640, partial [Polyangiales bacterium]|nr:hypothetical protein [Polyangiales bacterium]
LHQQRRLLREPTPDAIVQVTRKQLSRAQAQHIHLMAAASIATYHAYWGYFGRALSDVDEHDWTGAPGLFMSGRHRVRALVHLLSRDDLAAGLVEAEQALRLLDGPSAPGIGKAREQARALLAIAQLMAAGTVTPEQVTQLEAHRKRMRYAVVQVLADWALGVAYTAAGRTQDAERVRAALLESAPHCAPLLDFSLGARAGTGAVASSAVAITTPALGADGKTRVCALHPERDAAITCRRCGAFACAECAHGVRAEARVCAACHRGYAEQRQSCLPAERRARACGVLLLVLGMGWFLVALALGAMIAWRGRGWDGLIAVIFPSFLGVMALRRASLLRRMQPGGKPGVFVLAMGMFMLVPLGWLMTGLLFYLYFSEKGRLVLSADYLPVMEATPEIHASASRGFVALGLASALLPLALMAAAMANLAFNLW